MTVIIKNVVCVGASMSALSLIRHMVEHSDSRTYRWTVLEKSNGVGGRVATRRWGENGLWNMGPSVITTNDKEFCTVLDRWKKDTKRDPNQFGCDYINLIPKTLWTELQDQCDSTGLKLQILKKAFVTSIEKNLDHSVKNFEVRFDHDDQKKSVSADLVIVHAPIPQAQGWTWKNIKFPSELENITYKSEDIPHPSSQENSVHHWKYANVQKAHPDFYFFEDGLAFCGDGFSCGILPSRENGVERAWISGRSLAQFLKSI